MQRIASRRTSRRTTPEGAVPSGAPGSVGGRLLFVLAGCSRRIIGIRAPGRMVEMDDPVAVDRGDGGRERQGADVIPVRKRAGLEEVKALFRALVGHVNVESELSLGAGIPLVVDESHDLIAEVGVVAPGMTVGDFEAHVFGRPGRL